MSADDVAGYTAPFHCAAAKAGAVAWPTMVPVAVPWCMRWLISGNWRMPFREMRSVRLRRGAMHQPCTAWRL